MNNMVNEIKRTYNEEESVTDGKDRNKGNCWLECEEKLLRNTVFFMYERFWPKIK